MINIDNTNDLVRLLRKIQTVGGFKSAVIAGGAVRDLYFEQFFRDVDIFVWDPNFSDEDTNQFKVNQTGSLTSWVDLLQLKLPISAYRAPTLSDDFIKRLYKEDETYVSSDGKIIAVYDALRSLIPIQLIYTRIPPIDHVNKFFNLGLCKAYFDGRKFRFTPDFMHDARHKQFSIVGQDMTQQEWKRTIEEHIPRLSSRFPGYQTRVASHNQKFLEKKKTIVYST